VVTRHYVLYQDHAADSRAIVVDGVFDTHEEARLHFESRLYELPEPTKEHITLPIAAESEAEGISTAQSGAYWTMP
jgi:hypothetical protein